MTDGKPYTERMLFLAEKWTNGSVTPEEQQEFVNWYNQFDDSELRYPGPEGVGQQMHEDLLRQIQSLKPDRRISIIRWAAAATVLLAVSTFGLYYYWKTNHTTNAIAQSNSSTVQPGSDQAILTLSSGRQIVLSPQMQQITDSGVIIGNQQGLLTYQGLDKAEAVWNTMTTPRGGSYRVVLPDGTLVWLNAESSIRFPTAFKGAERRVEVSGEVYFEVAKNPAKPFRVDVTSVGRTIDVLGTNFNVNAYTGEPFQTSLLQGSIQIGQQLLRPGQAYTDGRVHSTDTTQAVAWKNGFFQFNQTDIKLVMRQLERWYAINVVYDGAIPDKTFVGELPRTAPLAQVLRILSKTGLHFTMEGTTMTVRK